MAIENNRPFTPPEGLDELDTDEGQISIAVENPDSVAISTEDGGMIKQAQINNKPVVKTIKRPDGTESVGVYNPEDNSLCICL